MPIAILALAAVNFAAGTQGFVFAGVLAELAADLGISIGRAGAIVTVAAVTFALAAPFAVMASARFDRRMVIVVSLVVLALINVASSFASNVTVLMALRVCAGLATAFAGSVASASVASLVAPEQRGRAFALVVGGMTVAFVLGIPLGSVVGGFYGWRATFIFAAGVIMIAVALVIAFLPRLELMTSAGMNLSAVASNGTVTRLLILTFVGFCAMFTVVSFVGPLVTHATGATGAGVGGYQLFVGIGSMIGLVIGGNLADRDYLVSGLVGLFLVMAATLLGYGVVLYEPSGTTPPVVLAGLILVGASSLFAMMPLNLARLSISAGPAAPIALSLNASLSSLGQGVGALWGGFLTDMVGFAWVGVGGMALALMGALIAVQLRGPSTAPAKVPMT
ncbi:MAG: MFS transporter [Alphaproteobacteria bacterium]